MSTVKLYRREHLMCGIQGHCVKMKQFQLDFSSQLISNIIQTVQELSVCYMQCDCSLKCENKQKQTLTNDGVVNNGVDQRGSCNGGCFNEIEHCHECREKALSEFLSRCVKSHLKSAIRSCQLNKMSRKLGHPKQHPKISSVFF